MAAPVPCRIFRITHFENLAGILAAGGIRCGAEMNRQGAEYLQIGRIDITRNRQDTIVTKGPEGTLSDYVPFYFCSRSVMLFNIQSGLSDFKGGQEPVIHLVSTVEALVTLGCEFVFTDRHARTRLARQFDDLSDLEKLPWNVIKSQNFKKTEDDPDRMHKKQAEFLAHRFVPVEAIKGIGVYSESWKQRCEDLLAEFSVKIPVKVKTGWYY